MFDLFKTPAFGLILTIVAYQIGLWVKRKTASDFANPLVIAMVLIIAFLTVAEIPYADYMIGAQGIHYVLGPLTVALGLMLYRQRALIKKHFLALLVGIFSGVLTSFFSILMLSRLVNLDEQLMTSSFAKSITMPMALSLTEILDGMPAITVVMVIIAGTGGALLVPFVLKVLPKMSGVSVGVGIGTASHAVGTAKALELGEEEGALSSTAIGLAGLMTVVIVPFLYTLFVK